MAAVMAGGMVPPTCDRTFVQHSSRIVLQRVKEKSGVSKLHHGIIIHYRRSYPVCSRRSNPRILPPCIVGSAVAGALSMAFKCGLASTTRWNLCYWSHHESSTILNFCSSWCSYWNDRYVIYKETIK